MKIFNFRRKRMFLMLKKYFSAKAFQFKQLFTIYNLPFAYGKENSLRNLIR